MAYASHFWENIEVTNLRQPPSHIIIVLIIPNRVTEALGLTRNNSECFLLVRISPRTSCKDTKNFGKKYSLSKKTAKNLQISEKSAYPCSIKWGIRRKDDKDTLPSIKRLDTDRKEKGHNVHFLVTKVGFGNDLSGKDIRALKKSERFGLRV